MSDTLEAFFGRNHLGCIAMMPIASCKPLPFHSVQCFVYHAYLRHPLAFYASIHACLHVHAWVLLAIVLSILQHNEAMDIRSKPSFVPCRHHLLFATSFACLLASLFLCLPCLSSLSALCLLIVLFASFPSMAYLLVSYLCLCMYAHRVRTHGARAQSLRWGCECADMRLCTL